jgi:hypothetical protein
MTHAIKTLAQESLDNRVKGRKDKSISYMQSFSSEFCINEEIAGRHIIFLHDFLDSPHIYRWMLHRDFYHWVTDTLDTLVSRGITIYLKPHPNQSEDSRMVVSRLQKRYAEYTNIKWLSDRTSNYAIFQQRPALVVSVYGSVIAEAAYFSVRSLSAGDHPAYNFKLSYNPTTLHDYHEKLINPELVPPPDPSDAISFIAQHMHYLHDEGCQSLQQFLASNVKLESRNNASLRSQEVSEFVESAIESLLTSHSFK